MATTRSQPHCAEFFLKNMPVGLIPARPSCKAVLLSLLWLALAFAEDVAAPHQQPNVLLIVIDDTGFADISYNNQW